MRCRDDRVQAKGAGDECLVVYAIASLDDFLEGKLLIQADKVRR